MMAKILIVDDQPCVQELLSEELLSEAYSVVTAGDGESVKGQLRFSRPDLVALDLYLDEADGFGVFQEIKRQAPDLPVIIFTACDGYRDDSRLSHADGYVIKSMALDELKGRIKELLRYKISPHVSGETIPVSNIGAAYAC
jgi:two-component system phosphate regulon response regulator PhoB